MARRPDEPHSVQLNVRIPPDLRNRLRDFCDDNGVDMKTFAAVALLQQLRKPLRLAASRRKPTAAQADRRAAR